MPASGARVAAWVEGLERRFRSSPVDWVVGTFLATKALVLLVAYALLEAPSDFLRDLSVRWDGNYYWEIARSGYAPLPDGEDPLAFGPFFPALIRLAGASVLTPLAVSVVAGAVAVGVITRLWGPRAGLFFALWPVWMATSSFGYSESTFVLLAALALWGARVGHGTSWAGSGLATGAAVATRYGGLLVFPSFLGLLARAGRRAWIAYGVTAGACAAFIAYFFWSLGGSVFAYKESQAFWEGALRNPWAQLQYYLHGRFTTGEPWRTVSHPANWALRNYFFVAVSALGVAHLWLRKRDLVLVAFCVPVLLVAVSMTGLPAISTPRVLLLGFPAIAILGRRLHGAGTWFAYALLSGLASCWIVVEHLTTFFA